MRKSLLFLLLLIGQHLLAQSCDAYKQQFWQQMSATCAPGLRWEKTVAEVDEDGVSTTETKTFDLDCVGGFATAGETKIPLNPAEFGHLFEFAYDNPYIADDLELTTTERSTEAHPKAGKEPKLRLQRFVNDAETGKLTVAEAHIVKGSPLYDLDVHITVNFDKNGRYQSHQVETKTVVLLGGTIHTQINAKLL